MRWILLAATLCSLYMTLHTLGLLDYLERYPAKLKRLLFGKSSDTLIPDFSDGLEQAAGRDFKIFVAMISVGVTFALVRETYREFFG